MRKTLVVAGVLVLCMVALSCCGALNAPKAPVNVLLNAWIEKDYKEAFSCLAPALQEAKTFEAFKEDVDRVRVESYDLTSVNVNANGSAEVKGSLTVEDGTKTGCNFQLIQKGDYWLIIGYDISPDLLFEDDEEEE